MTWIMLLLIRFLALHTEQDWSFFVATLDYVGPIVNTSTTTRMAGPCANNNVFKLPSSRPVSRLPRLGFSQGPEKDILQTHTTICAEAQNLNGQSEMPLLNEHTSVRSPMEENVFSITEQHQLLPPRVKKPLVEAHQHQIYSDVDAIAGRLVRLPCFVRPLSSSDSVSLVLWYRGDDISGSPIYSVDARYTPFSQAQHFVHKDYQNRQIMNFTLNKLDTQEAHLGSESRRGGHIFSNSNSLENASQPIESKPVSASTAHLYMMPVEESDAGLYWCRVDYKWERTTISIVTVNVIVPPQHLQIQIKPGSIYCPGEKACSLVSNQTITLNEDSAVTFVCFSEGGKPLPLLNWYRNDELVRSEIFHSLAANSHTLQSELHLTKVDASEHKVLLKCLSSNDNHSFLNSQIRLRVNTKPSLVEILPFNGSHTVLLSGSQVTAVCRSFGSRPAANHTWAIVPDHKQRLLVAKQYVLIESQLRSQHPHQQQQPVGDNSNQNALSSLSDEAFSDVDLVTESVVHFTVQPEDNGHRLVCRAENNLLPRNALESSIKLNIAFAPKVTLQQLTTVGNSSSSSSSDRAIWRTLSSGYAIRGGDLHLLCNITANPSAEKVLWYKNALKITEVNNNNNNNQVESFTTVKMANNGTHFVIGNITDEWQGFYQCIAHNKHGSGFSNQLQVQILYEPQCITHTQTIPANIGSRVTMICDVDANPGNVTFFWNTKHKDLRQMSLSTNSLEANDPNSIIIKDKGLKSRLQMQITTGDNFGQYSCWAQNLVGRQQEPCYYNIYENPIKHQLLCETNISHQVIRVQCQPESVSLSEFGSPTVSTSSSRSFDVHSSQPTNVLFNLRIFKQKHQLVNITSVEPNFLLAVDELLQKEYSRSEENGQIERNISIAENEKPSGEEKMAYKMLISTLANGQLISDVSLTFKVPAQPESNAIVNLSYDRDFDMEDGLQEQALSPELSISRYKKIQFMNEKPRSKDTNAASFTTAVTIKQLPLIWTVFLAVIILLTMLIFLVLGRLYFRKRRRHKKPHVHFSQHHQELQDSHFDAGHGLSSKEYLMENELEQQRGTEEELNKKESIQLFTLTNYERAYSLCNADKKNVGVEDSHIKHVNCLKSALPDLMADTFAYDCGDIPVMENSQHNLYLIPKPADDKNCNEPLSVCNHQLVSFDSHLLPSDSEHHQYDHFRTLPNMKHRQLIRISVEQELSDVNDRSEEQYFIKRTPSVDAVHSTDWLPNKPFVDPQSDVNPLVKGVDTRSPLGQCPMAHACSNDALCTNQLPTFMS